ncbi:MAG TPA: HEAT repeat domain-containing protein [Streptosporangiaceae bacterium]|nr:HEAT repeat domain-containing protein [Streptosporangiaceae bacterium]
MADVALGHEPADGVVARLAGLSGREWLRLDESARWRGWYGSPLTRIDDWHSVLADRQSVVVAVAGSMHPDGRIRQAAVSALAATDGPLSMTALAVRTADWVPEVADAAQTALAARSVLADLVATVPVMRALTTRRRGRDIAANFLRDVANGPANVLKEVAATSDRSSTVWALGVLRQRSEVSDDALAARAVADPDPQVALWCAQQLLTPQGHLPLWAGELLLHSRRARVRAFTVGHLDDADLGRDALAARLLDRSAGVRAMAQWRWSRSYGNPILVYQDALAVPGAAASTAAALQGLAATAAPNCVVIAAPFLTSPSPAVRSAATHAIGQRGTPEEVITHLAPLILRNDSNKVFSAAMQYLRSQASALPPQVIDDLDRIDTPRARRTVLTLRQHLGHWTRVHADLRAMNGDDPALAESARSDLLTWLNHHASTAYGQPTPHQAAEIAQLLDTDKLNGNQHRAISFVAGIRPTHPQRQNDSPLPGDRRFGRHLGLTSRGTRGGGWWRRGPQS